MINVINENQERTDRLDRIYERMGYSRFEVYEKLQPFLRNEGYVHMWFHTEMSGRYTMVFYSDAIVDCFWIRFAEFIRYNRETVEFYLL